jgi:hypothetical protein
LTGKVVHRAAVDPLPGSGDALPESSPSARRDRSTHGAAAAIWFETSRASRRVGTTLDRLSP